MKKVDMSYSFHSKEDPTDEQLQQLMKEACDDAKKKWIKTKELYFKQLKEASKVAKMKYEEQYGTA